MRAWLALSLVVALLAMACAKRHRSSPSAPQHDENYADFLRLWQASQAQERQTGADQLGPCSKCFFSNGVSMCSYPLGEDCGFYTKCVERDCLNADTYPPFLDDCVDSCMPLHDVICHEEWDDYVTCMVEACTSTCE
jgi:hypothetical protein